MASRIVIYLLLGLLSALPVRAALPDAELVKQFFPDSDGFSEFEGEPPAAKVFSGNRQLGYVFRTKPIAPIPAYSGKPIDMDYFMRITEGTDVPVYPCLVAWQLPKVEEMLDQAVAWYDAGAAGIGFWDPSGLCRNDVLWPVVSRMGHLEETRRRANLGAPAATALKLKRFGPHVYGRWNPMAGF